MIQQYVAALKIYTISQIYKCCAFARSYNSFKIVLFRDTSKITRATETKVNTKG